MEISEVPQDQGMIDNPDLKEICYALDENGCYVLAPSAGWEPKNVANDQAWALIGKQVANVVSRIRAGKLSPLAYHMAKHQMSAGLLAKYVGINRFRVWRHLKPSGFQRLTPEMRRRYADLFDLPVDALDVFPVLPEGED